MSNPSYRMTWKEYYPHWLRYNSLVIDPSRFVNADNWYAFYNRFTDRIYLVKKSPEKIKSMLKNINNANHAIISKSGFKVKHGYIFWDSPDIAKVKDLDDLYGRLFSHESIHKVLTNLGLYEASKSFDKIRMEY